MRSANAPKEFSDFYPPSGSSANSQMYAVVIPATLVPRSLSRYFFALRDNGSSMAFEVFAFIVLPIWVFGIAHSHLIDSPDRTPLLSHKGCLGGRRAEQSIPLLGGGLGLLRAHLVFRFIYWGQAGFGLLDPEVVYRCSDRPASEPFAVYGPFFIRGIPGRNLVFGQVVSFYVVAFNIWFSVCDICGDCWRVVCRDVASSPSTRCPHMFQLCHRRPRFLQSCTVRAPSGDGHWSATFSVETSDLRDIMVSGDAVFLHSPASYAVANSPFASYCSIWCISERTYPFAL